MLKMAVCTMGTALRKPQQSATKLLQIESLAYAIVKNVPGVQLPHTKAEKTNMKISIWLSLFLPSFSSHITQKLKDIHKLSTYQQKGEHLRCATSLGKHRSKLLY